MLLTTQHLEEADRLADRLCDLRLTVPAAVSLTRLAEEISGYAAGPVRRLTGHHGLDFPVVPRPGLVTELVRALDAAGIAVDDIAVRPPSLDDVFHSLTRPVAV